MDSIGSITGVARKSDSQIAKLTKGFDEVNFDSGYNTCLDTAVEIDEEAIEEIVWECKKSQIKYDAYSIAKAIATAIRNGEIIRGKG